MEPFVKAVGGKGWLAAKLAAEIMAAHPELYVESFVGGGAVALTLSPSIRKIIADANPALIEIWRVLKMYKPELLLIELVRVYAQYADTAFGYAGARDELNGYLSVYRPWPPGAIPLPAALVESCDLPPPRFAALALYIGARCYNGLWRVNQRGLMNVPWGKYKKPRRLTLGELRVYHEILVNTTAVCADFRQVFASVAALPRADRTKIAVYADSPYDGMFDGYTAEGFDEVDQRDLARWLQYLSVIGIHVWATNADTPLIREIYAWAKVEAITEYHSVAAKGNRRGDRGCLLIRSH